MAIVANTVTLAGTSVNISGKGPLPVVFDSSGTTAAGRNSPFQELDYRLDLSGGYLNTFGNKSVLDVTTMYGPILPTVWETSGTALLTITDPFTSETVQTLYTITVDNDWTTGVTEFYIDPDAGNDSNNGLTSGTAKLTWLGGHDAMITHNGPRALYVKRGATHITYGGTAGQKVKQFGKSGSFNAQTLIMPYGTGATPIVDTDGRGGLRTLGFGTGAPTINDPAAGQDVRVIDIEFNKTSSASGDPAFTFGFERSLFLRCKVNGYGVGWSFAGDGLATGFGDKCFDTILCDCTMDVATSSAFMAYSFANFQDVDKTWKRNGLLACKFKTLAASEHGVRMLGNHTAWYENDVDWVTNHPFTKDCFRVNVSDLAASPAHKYLYVYGGNIIADQTKDVQGVDFFSQNGNRFQHALFVSPTVRFQGANQAKMFNTTICDDFWIKSPVFRMTNTAITGNYDIIHTAGNNSNVVILAATVHGKSNCYLFRNAGFATTGLRIEGCNHDDIDGASNGLKIVDHTSGLLSETTVKNCNLRGNPINKILVAGVGYKIADWETVKPGSNNVEVDPMFVDRVNGDYHLQSGSTLIDAISVADTIKEVFRDADAMVVPFDGDGNGTAQQDIGAYEFGAGAPPPPPVSGVARLTTLGLGALIRAYQDIGAKPPANVLAVARRRGLNVSGSRVGTREVQHV